MSQKSVVIKEYLVPVSSVVSMEFKKCSKKQTNVISYLSNSEIVIDKNYFPVTF